jgi:hypothetical protein
LPGALCAAGRSPLTVVGSEGLESDDFALTCFVIASEAKQSNGASLDCFASLAMTI